ncbi:MAG: hypothetical protein CVU51_14845 [Deltaproteobacteria bacterium HGW-Deltaproteobacteria-1]|jgi:hypothetical protein|nr:MAG: hypothetical protein CVU51_14845 [Deltaproteobacteria bacterium HGW-Deltaproteobacteria-1]
MWLKQQFRFFIVFTIFFVVALCLSGCAIKKPGSDNVNSQINVFNRSLFAIADKSPINGVSPRREPCISGYEFYYDDLDLILSFHNNDRVWRITSRNKRTSIFGIAPGDSFAQAKEKIARLGFTQSYTPYKFAKDWCLFTLLVDEKNNVFGMTIEVLD